ncbi:DUF3108 domain-containing protein [bacterium]|nr:DUF3108 domain-containing protein [bacterium]
MNKSNKISIIIIFLCTIFVQIAAGKLQSSEDREKALKALEGIEIPRPANLDAFGVGEYLDFGVYVALPGIGKIPLKGGHGILSVPTIVERDGHLCYWIRSLAFSTGIVGQVYPVSDTIESFMDVDSLFPWYFRKRVREGNFRDRYEIKFDQTHHRAIRNDVFDVETFPRVQDILSAFYYVRTLNLEPGDTIPLPYHEHGGNYPINVIVHSRERIKVPAGKFDCLKIEPIIATDGLFKKEGTMYLWITDDKCKMPVKMVSKIPVGSMQAILLEYIPGDTDWR